MGTARTLFVPKTEKTISHNIMKLSNAVFFFGLTSAKPSIMGEKLAQSVRRTIQGEWVNKMIPRTRREDVDGSKGFRPLAAMILYMQGFDAAGNDPETHNNFNSELENLENIYTNYGCYCWIDGTDAGVIGGGKVKDMTDHHCKELYRCYKCVNIDYAQNYTDVDYVVDFTQGDSGRELDCSVNAKQDAENICECDKRFAAAISATEKSCRSNAADNPMFGSYCLNEDWRTTTGKILGTNNSGSFKPRQQCDKKLHDHDKDECCGIYPNRYPYDENFNECCQENQVDGDARITKSFNLMKKGECEPAGGVVVVSEEGNPHNYVAV